MTLEKDVEIPEGSGSSPSPMRTVRLSMHSRGSQTFRGRRPGEDYFKQLEKDTVTRDGVVTDQVKLSPVMLA